MAIMPKLSKPICVNCINKYCSMYGAEILEWFEENELENNWQWDKSDNDLWKDEMVHCPDPISNGGFRASINEPPPEYCPYALEHIISQ